MSEKKVIFQVNDKVVKSKDSGLRGIVKEIRTETTSKQDSRDSNNIMIQVLWDNGTLSYMSPESINKI